MSEEEKTRRIVELQGVQREIQLELHGTMVGEEVDVLVDSISRRRDWELSGRTSSNSIVNFAGPRDWLGRLVRVRLTRAGAFSVAGDAIAVEGRASLVTALDSFHPEA